MMSQCDTLMFSDLLCRYNYNLKSLSSMEKDAEPVGWRTPRRFRGFLVANCTVGAVAVFSHFLSAKALERFSDFRVKDAASMLLLRGEDWFRMYLASCSRIAAFLAVICASASSKKPLLGEKRTKGPKDGDAIWLLLRAFGSAAVLETVAMAASTRWLGRKEIARWHFSWFLGFVRKSFFFEVVFDFFHYWSHRVCHEVPFLYQFHKSHHKYLHPSPLSTYQQDSVDLILTNVVPQISSLSLLKSACGITFSPFEYSLLISYKVFVEIAGHAGIETNATSFPQFAPLPKLLGIEMRTKDHDAHHAFPQKSCNFSKRFVLWDKMFGTFMRNSKTSL